MVVEPARVAIMKSGRMEDSRDIIQGTGYGLIVTH